MIGMTDEPVTHHQYAKRVDVPADMLRSLLDDAVLPHLAKKGPSYTVDPTVLPDGERIVALHRELYRERLRVALGATKRVSVELEAVQLDLTDALENGTDPVDVLGADMQDIITTTGSFRQALSDLSFALIQAVAVHGELFAYDRVERLRRRASDPPPGG